MKRLVIAAAAVMLAAFVSRAAPAGAYSFAAPPVADGDSVNGERTGPELAAKTGAGIRLLGCYLRRESAVEREDYTRVRIAWDSGNRFLNLSAGVETRLKDGQVRTYWIGDDIVITDRLRGHARLNHTEYGDWKTGINYLNAYISYERWWLRLGVGIGYAALVFEEGEYNNPFVFNSEAPETRFIYNVSLRPSFWNDRIEIDLGFKNYDDFEYHGFDDNGYHIEPIIHVTDKLTVSYFYERRYAGAFISLPTLARTTWMASIEYRF